MEAVAFVRIPALATGMLLVSVAGAAPCCPDDDEKNCSVQCEVVVCPEQAGPAQCQVVCDLTACPDSEKIAGQTLTLAPLLSPMTYTIAFEGEPEPGASTRTVHIVEIDGDDKYELSIKNDDVKVKHNGLTIDDKYVHRTDSGFIVTDDEGNEIHSFHYTNPTRRGTFDVSVRPVPGAFDGDSALAFLGGAQIARQIAGGEQPRVMIGITMSEPDETLQRQFGLKGGIVIDRVIEGLPAQRAGVEPGDVVVSIEGVELVSPDALREVLKDKEPGSEIRIKVLRGGTFEDATVELQPYDPGALGIGSNVPQAEGLRDMDLDRWARDLAESVQGLDAEEIHRHAQRAIEDALRERGMDFQWHAPAPGAGRFVLRAPRSEDDAQELLHFAIPQWREQNRLERDRATEELDRLRAEREHLAAQLDELRRDREQMRDELEEMKQMLRQLLRERRDN